MKQRFPIQSGIRLTPEADQETCEILSLQHRYIVIARSEEESGALDHPILPSPARILAVERHDTL